MKEMINENPSTLGRQKLKYLFNRVIKRIKEKPRGYFMFKKMRGTWGLYEFDDGITIDPRRDIIPTIIHEVLHDLYPKNWEGWTRRVESKITNVLTPYDIYCLLTCFFQKLDIGPRVRGRRAKKSKKVKRTPRAGQSKHR
jgi:hypothetical protein